jgi:hypothetical protein
MTRGHPGRSAPGIARREIGCMPDGSAAHEYVLANGAGMALSAINLGGIALPPSSVALGSRVRGLNRN